MIPHEHGVGWTALGRRLSIRHFWGQDIPHREMKSEEPCLALPYEDTSVSSS